MSSLWPKLERDWSTLLPISTIFDMLRKSVVPQPCPPPLITHDLGSLTSSTGTHSALKFGDCELIESANAHGSQPSGSETWSPPKYITSPLEVHVLPSMSLICNSSNSHKSTSICLYGILV